MTDIGTEELAHMEMIAAMVYKLVEGASPKDYEEAGWTSQYTQHNHGLFWTDANGVPWCASYIACLGDPIADLTENMVAEQKARVTVGDSGDGTKLSQTGDSGDGTKLSQKKVSKQSRPLLPLWK